jgi:hypothetical protein
MRSLPDFFSIVPVYSIEQLMRINGIIVGALVSIAACHGDDLPESVIQLARVKAKMKDLLEHLPDYTCVVTLQRATRSPRADDFKTTDTVRYEIAQSGGRELFAWPGARRFEAQSLNGAIHGGVISTGEFALHARAVFTDGYANFKFAGHEMLNARDALRWDFDIPLSGSGWTIRYVTRTARVGSRGSIWIEPDTLDLKKLEIQATGLPPDFPNTAAVSWVEYSRVMIGTRETLLPQTAALTLDEARGSRNRNVLEFSHCRQYIGESTISFYTTEKNEAKPAEPPAAEVRIPEGLVMRLQLVTAIDSERAAIGDPIEAALVSDVQHRGRVVFRSGTIVRGRLRRIEQRSGLPRQLAVDLEFNSIGMDGQRARFFGNLVRVDSRVPGLRAIARPPQYEVFHVPKVPGLATLIFEGSGVHLPAGMMMTWVSREWTRAGR